MKTQKPLYFTIVLFFAMSQGSALASDAQELADDIEKPDTLLQATQPGLKKLSYGEEKIVISGEGDKNNDIVTPDPLEKTVRNKEKKSAVSKDFELKVGNITEEDKALEHADPLLGTTNKKAVKKLSNPSGKNDDLEMPDPLLDSIN